jgi:hypothetical protein
MAAYTRGADDPLEHSLRIERPIEDSEAGRGASGRRACLTAAFNGDDRWIGVSESNDGRKCLGESP